MKLQEARRLMHEWVDNRALRVHMEAVSACMRAAALRHDPSMSPGEVERWRIAGMLHDFDYERLPDEHPVPGVAYLRTLGVDDEICDAILGHYSEKTGVARETRMAKALFAVDELAGFIVACAKVRPDGLASLEPKSVVKKLRTPSFAAAVNRTDIAMGTTEMGVEQSEQIAMCIEAMRNCQEVVV